MRRSLAALIVALSLLVATAAWVGFTLTRTVLDPGRSERLAAQLLDNEEVRAALVSRLADELEARIPPNVPVPRQVIESGADVALDDPRVEALIIDGFVRAHQNALAGESEPVVIDAGALGQAGRDALVADRPELETVLPPVPPVAVELPTTGVAWLGTVKQTVDRYTLLAALLAMAGLLAAMLVAEDKAPVFRRIAYWAYGVSAFWLAIGFAVPWVAARVSPTSAAVATAVIDVFFGAMIRPALFMAFAATVSLLISVLLPARQRRLGSKVLDPIDPGRPAPSEPATTDRGFGARSGTVTRPGGPVVAPAGSVDEDRTRVWRAEPLQDRTREMPRPMPDPAATGATPRSRP